MYLWIFVVGIIFSFYNAWGGGANDCANSFATSVGSNVLTLRQALLIASVFEFSGAVLMGSHVTNAIRKKIVDSTIYEEDPGILMYGMMCASLSSAIWLTVATFLKWPVSTTHSIIGSIIGFSLVYGGENGLNWEKVGFVVLSWFLSPILAGLFSSSSFYTINRFVFRTDKPYEKTAQLFPLITFFTFFINTLFIIYKGSPQLKLKDTPLWIAIVASLCIGIFTAVLAYHLYLPYAKRKIEKEEQLKLENEQTEGELETRTDSYSMAIEGNDYTQFKYDNNKTIEDNIKLVSEFKTELEMIKYNDDNSKLYSNAHEIDYKAEKLCSWIQVITACFSSFAHGSNDVANAMAPLATIYYIYENNENSKKMEVPIWILALGGFGMVVGLATWGYKIINRMGRDITKISTSRGFIIELGAALTVIIASRIGMPVSTTHCQVGSIVGCGLVGGKKNIQWKLLKGIFFSWFITLPFTGLLSAAIFSYGIYSP
jgi:sodium-dependent phosphate transporter